MTLVLENLPLPARIRPETPMSDEELLRFCAANDSVRIERAPDGELIVMTPTGSESSGMNSEINAELTIWTRSDGRGKAFDSSGGFTLPDGSMLNPDGAWVELRRWLALTGPQRNSFAPICPDFVLELRSNSDSLPVLEAKMKQWIANGAQVAWLIDPIRRAVTIYCVGQQPELLTEPTSVQGTGPIAGFELVMERVWG